jgi:hypothetical protein
VPKEPPGVVGITVVETYAWSNAPIDPDACNAKLLLRSANAKAAVEFAVVKVISPGTGEDTTAYESADCVVAKTV